MDRLTKSSGSINTALRVQFGPRPAPERLKDSLLRYSKQSWTLGIDGSLRWA